ncbi:leucine-rich repeat protein [Agathobacter ruminis]|nr:leucine-rich repeat protein [Agathobacter ruminis]MDC7301230.1 leucine-rich repeat protein [Agathobacter ruminis]
MKTNQKRIGRFVCILFALVFVMLWKPAVTQANALPTTIVTENATYVLDESGNMVLSEIHLNGNTLTIPKTVTASDGKVYSVYLNPDTQITYESNGHTLTKLVIEGDVEKDFFAFNNANYAIFESLKEVTIKGAIDNFDELLWENAEYVSIARCKKVAKSWSICSFKLKTIQLPEGITSLPDYAFNSCHNLQTVKFPKSLTSIGEQAFCDCKSLKTMTIPDTVTTLGDSVFQSCIKLERVTVGKRVKKIPEWTFSGCKKFYQLIITGNQTRVEEDAWDLERGNNITIVAPKSSYARQDALRNHWQTSTSTKVQIVCKAPKTFVGGRIDFVVLNAHDIKVTSSNKSVLAVSGKNYYVKGKKAGSANLVVTYNGKKYSKKITVVKRTKKNVLNLIYKYAVTPEMSDYEKACATIEWFDQNVELKWGVFFGTPVESTADGCLVKGKANLYGLCDAFSVIMKHYGIATYTVTSKIREAGQGTSTIVWSQVKIGGKWYHLRSMTGYDYRTTNFLLNTKEARKAHRGKWSKYKTANSKSSSVNKQINHTGYQKAVINYTSATVKSGKSLAIKVTGTKQRVSYRSSDTKIFTVNKKGVVSAKGKGVATLYVTIGKKTFPVTITVK